MRPSLTCSVDAIKRFRELVEADQASQAASVLPNNKEKPT